MPASLSDPVRCLIFDLGAGSGRAIVAWYDGAAIRLEEVYRFQAVSVERPDGPHWDIEQLKSRIEDGIQAAIRHAGRIDSIGIDSWGLDYALLDGEGNALGEPFHYRHPRSQRGYDHSPLKAAQMFGLNGIQDLPVNTAYQLFDEARTDPARIGRAESLLMIADVLNHHLTGNRRSEITLARTSGLIAVRTGEWNQDLCRSLGLPAHLLQPLIRPGEVYGALRPALAERLGATGTRVIAVAAHDTASAVAALPLRPGRAFLIAGSWFLVGVECTEPRLDLAVSAAGFGNESGAGGRTALLKSLPGFHLMQKLRDSWRMRTGQDIPFADMAALAQQSETADQRVAIDLTDPAFFNPADIVAELLHYGSRHDLHLPPEIGPLALALYAGLVRQVSAGLALLRQDLGYAVDTLVIGGGGARDTKLRHLLGQSGLGEIATGPVEASAWGNALFQLIGLGAIASLDEGRRVIERSFLDSEAH